MSRQWYIQTSQSVSFINSCESTNMLSTVRFRYFAFLISLISLHYARMSFFSQSCMLITERLLKNFITTSVWAAKSNFAFLHLKHTEVVIYQVLEKKKHSFSFIKHPVIVGRDLMWVSVVSRRTKDSSGKGGEKEVTVGLAGYLLLSKCSLKYLSFQWFR